MKMIKTNKTKLLSRILLTLFTMFAIVIVGCEGPAGPQGEQGPSGPVGPAGDDGSAMYSGTTAPGASLGNPGDYYINLSTSELYGPKDQTSGWGTPIDLSGEDGADGQDGNTILNGSGNPDASIGTMGDFYIDVDTYNLWGPKGEALAFNNGGWGILPAINLQATANATVHYFDGFDYTTGNIYNVTIDGVTQQELAESSWNVYLSTGTDGAGASYHVPGYGSNGASEYRVFHQIGAGSTFQIDIRKVSGPGEVYQEVRVVQVLAGNVQDNRTKSLPNSFTVKDLNFDNYEEVAQYYGLNR